jgi:hydrogenase maturation factor
MCTELPVELAEVRRDATARGWVGGRAAGRLTEISLVLLDRPAVSGDWVVAHAGFALHRISAAAAQDALAIHAGAPSDRLPTVVQSEADRGLVVTGTVPEPNGRTADASASSEREASPRASDGSTREEST